MATRKLEVEIVGDASSLKKAFGQAGSVTDGFGSSLAKLGKLAAVGLAAVGAGAVAAGVKMVTMAGDAAEVDSKMQVVFGKQLPGLKKNLDAFADATGASSFKLREQAADLGALLGPLVGTKAGASDMSAQFVKLATDLGSFNNVPVEEALLAIRSGLVGEAEPLRRFGVLINAAAVEAEGLRLGLVKGNEEMTEQQKVMARASLIMKQTSQAQGDATRTADSYANQIKALKNNVTDLATGLGTKLLPAATAVAGGLNDFINKISEADGAGAKFGVAMDAIKTIAASAAAGLVAVFQKIDWSKTWDSLVASAATIATRLRDALDQKLGAVDWGNVGKKIADGITNAIEAVGAVGKKIGDTITAAMHRINWVDVGKTAGPGLAAALVTAFATIMDPAFWIKNWDLALAVAMAVFGKGIGKLAAPLGTAIKGVLGKAFDDGIQAIVVVAAKFGPLVEKVVLAGLLVVKAMIVRTLEGFVAVVKAAFGKLGALAQFTVRVLGITGAINAISQFAQAVFQKIQAIIGWFQELPGRIRGALPSGILTDIGSAIIQGLWSGMTAKWAAVAGWLGSLAGKVKGLKGPESKDATLLEPEGKAIILGLETGMMASWATLAPKINALGGKIIHNFILGISAAQPAFTGKMAQAAQQALDAARTVVEGYQTKLATAFGTLGDYAKRAFEAKTQGMTTKIGAQFDTRIAGINAFKDSLTPAELALRQLGETESALSRQSALDTANAAMVKAQALDAGIAKEQEAAVASAAAAMVKAQAMDAGVEKELAVAAASELIRQANLASMQSAMDAGIAKEQAVAVASEQIRQANLANTRAALEAQAEVERSQRDATAALQIAFLEAQKARELANMEERTRTQGEKLDQQLAQLADRLSKHPEEYDKIQKKIQALLASHGIPMQKAGANLGAAFARGLRSQVDEVEAAARALARAVERQLKGKSPTEAGPMSTLDTWWSGVGKTLVSGLDYRPVVNAAQKLASSLALPPLNGAALAGAAPGGGGSGGGQRMAMAGGGGRTVVLNVNFNGPVRPGDGAQLAAELYPELAKVDRRYGGRMFNSNRPALS